ncbi:Cytochrome c oxidase assembly protein COX15 [Apiospora arundinis]
MYFTPQLISILLLAAPTLISAAPAADFGNGDAVVARDAELEYGASVEPLFARQATCNAPRPTDPKLIPAYEENQRKMADATTKAHAGQRQCPGTSRVDFQKIKKDKKKRQAIKDKCVNGNKICVAERNNANNACKAMGGTVDEGHKNAVKVCQSNLKWWNIQKA